MISVVIPIYKNKELFLRNLNHNLPFLKNCQIIIVNDDPEKSWQNELKKISDVILIENAKNLGFGQSINIGVGRAKNDYIMLLNSDVILNDESYKATISLFNNNKNLFAIGFAQKEKDGSIVGKNQIYWSKGMLYHKRADNLNFGFTAWAEGGACLLDKKKFLKLGGIDPLYSPFYWEDIDLSYRAWKAGYKIFFDPNIVVDHQHESTIGKYFTNRYIKVTAFCHQFIFIWKNITDRSLYLSHLFFLPYNLIYFLLKGEGEFIAGFLGAMKCLGKIIKQKRTETKRVKLSDRRVLKLFTSNL
jgi:GT2 family glycosyltransferase